MITSVIKCNRFLSTPSARRATSSGAEERGLCVIYNTPLRVLAYPLPGISRKRALISIHALREEGDARLLPLRYGLAISIHALREEGDTLPRR